MRWPWRAGFGEPGGPEPASSTRFRAAARRPLRPGTADQLRHLQGRLGGPPGAGDARAGPTTTGVLGQLLRRPRTGTRAGLLHRRADDRVPKTEYLYGTALLARRHRVVRAGLRRGLQALGRRHRVYGVPPPKRRRCTASSAPERRLPRAVRQPPSTTTARSPTTT